VTSPNYFALFNAMFVGLWQICSRHTDRKIVFSYFIWHDNFWLVVQNLLLFYSSTYLNIRS